jgi:hypothetical protein
MIESLLDFLLEIKKQLDLSISRKSGDRVAPLDQADQDRDHCQEQQNVNESTQCVRADHAKQPENHQQNGYSPEHRHSFRGRSCVFLSSNSTQCTQAMWREVSSEVPSRGAISLYL